MIILLLLLCWGCSNLITTEYVFKWFRKLIWKINIKLLTKLTSCPNCLSFWIGLGLSFIIPVPIIGISIISNIIYGLLGFSITKLLNIILVDKMFDIDDDFDKRRNN